MSNFHACSRCLVLCRVCLIISGGKKKHIQPQAHVLEHKRLTTMRELRQSTFNSVLGVFHTRNGEMTGWPLIIWDKINPHNY